MDSVGQTFAQAGVSPLFCRSQQKVHLNAPPASGSGAGPAIDHAKGTGDNAITAAIADVVLHEDGADFSTDDRAGGTGLEAAGILTLFANIGEKNPAERIPAVAA
jgi:hypothetical protein